MHQTLDFPLGAGSNVIRALRMHYLAVAMCIWGFTGSLRAQDLSLTRPGSLNLFRPFSSADEGNFTPFPVRISGYATTGYDDNVFAQHTGTQGSIYNEFGLSTGINVGNERSQVTADMLTGFVAYWQRPGKKVDPDLNLDLAVNHQFNERTVFSFASSVTYQTQPNIGSGNGVPNFVGNYLDASGKVSLGFQWTPRIATFTSYSFDLLHYDSQSVGRTQDRVEHLIGEEIRYLWRPKVVAVGEYRFGDIHYLYDETANSHSQYLLGGGDFLLSHRLRFSCRAGAELRHLDRNRGSDVSYPYAETTFTYLYRPESTIDWYNRYGLEQSDNLQPGYRETFRTGLKVSHRIGGKTRAVAAVYYSHNEYHDSPASEENLVEADLELIHQITRRLRLLAGYTLTRDISSIASSDYVRNRLFGGFSYAF